MKKPISIHLEWFIQLLLHERYYAPLFVSQCVVCVWAHDYLVCIKNLALEFYLQRSKISKFKVSNFLNIATHRRQDKKNLSSLFFVELTVVVSAIFFYYFFTGFFVCLEDLYWRSKYEKKSLKWTTTDCIKASHQNESSAPFGSPIFFFSAWSRLTKMMWTLTISYKILIGICNSCWMRFLHLDTTACARVFVRKYTLGVCARQ